MEQPARSRSSSGASAVETTPEPVPCPGLRSVEHGVGDLFGDELFRRVRVFTRMRYGDDGHLVRRAAHRHARNDHGIVNRFIAAGDSARPASLRHVLIDVAGVAGRPRLWLRRFLCRRRASRYRQRTLIAWEWRAKVPWPA